MKAEKKSWFVRHKIWTGVLVLIVLVIIGSAASSGNKSTNSNANSTNSNSQASNTSDQASAFAKIGQPARDGKFDFTVNSIKCGQPNVGSDYLTKTAQGQYCLLYVKVTNIGNEKQSLFSSNQKLFDAANKQYSADDVATTYAGPQGSTWYSDVNPGNSVEGVIVFDLPKDVAPTMAELHDSAFSGGVKVELK